MIKHNMIKTFLSLIFILIIYSFSFSQTIEKNLKLVGFDSIDSITRAGVGGQTPIFTVPSGKIWKIENIICTTNCLVFVNGKEIIRAANIGSTPTYTCYNPNTSLWLKSGDRIAFSLISPNSVDMRSKFSYFEFVLE
jgi:hypothetical protein